MVSGNPSKNALFETRPKKILLPLKEKGFFIYKPIYLLLNIQCLHHCIVIGYINAHFIYKI
jgi:hypothetical protein